MLLRCLSLFHCILMKHLGQVSGTWICAIVLSWINFSVMIKRLGLLIIVIFILQKTNKQTKNNILNICCMKTKLKWVEVLLKLTPMMESNCIDFLDMWLTWRLKNKKSLLAKSFRTLLLLNIYHHVVLSRQQLRPRHGVDIEEYICCSIQI